MEKLVQFSKSVVILAAASLLAAGSASATLISGSGLQTALTTAPNAAIVNVNTDQLVPDSYWSMGGTNASINVLMFELTTPNAAVNSFGIFDRSNPNNKVQIFGGSASTGDLNISQKRIGVYGTCFGLFPNVNDVNCSGSLAGTKTFGSAAFGYYLTNGQYTWYSDSVLNSDGQADHMVAFQGNNDGSRGSLNGSTWLSNEYLLAWEDSSQVGVEFPSNDFDDFVVLVESVTNVPEPSALALMGLGLLGLGVRSRKKANP